MSTQNRSGGGGGGRNKLSKANTQGQQNKELQKEPVNSTLAAGNVGDTNTTATNVNSGSQNKKTAANDHVKEQKEKPQMKVRSSLLQYCGKCRNESRFDNR